MILAAAAAASLGAPAAALRPVATQAQAQAAGDEFVEIPFAPPVGRTLRYRLIRERTGDGPARRSEVSFDVSFRRSGAFYIMRVQLVLPPGVPAPDAESAVARIFSRPTEFRLDESGEMLELLDLEEHWATADQVLQELDVARQLDARGRAAVAQMIGQMRALPPQAQLDLFARNVAPIVAAAGGAFPIGEELAEERPAQSILGELRQTATIRVDAVERGIVRLSTRSNISNEELQARVRTMFGNLAPPGQDVGRMRILSNEVVETYEVSHSTGLTLRYRAEMIVVTEENGERLRAADVRTLEFVH